MKKTIVVCGGSKGIGAATVRILLDRGYRVICISRTHGELEALLTKNNELVHLPCDLSLEIERKKISNILSRESNIIGLVNNASGPTTGPILNTTQLDFQKAFETHLFAANDLAQAVIPLMVAKGFGRIVNIISVTAKIPLENMGVSNTLRGAMLNWSKTLSKELGKNNITVNNVLPGYTETERLIEVINDVSKKMNLSTNEYSQRIINQVPLGRFGKSEEIASVVSFLLSDEASFITGASIPVDGGWTPCA